MRRLLPTLLLVAPLALAGPLTEGRLGEEKQRRLRTRGGNRATERAVEMALGWLAAHQGRDGSWDADGFMTDGGCACEGKGGGWHGEPVPCPFDREVTALATLAFLGAGQAPGREGHGETVARALRWLAAPQGRETLFATAYATQALAEAYDLTGEDAYRGPVERGIAVMLDAQQPQGGWRYWPGMRMTSGVPTSTAVVVALRTAEEAGFETGPAWRDPVLAWLDRLVDKKSGRVAYTLDGHRFGYTPTTTNAASALLVRAWLGRRSDDAQVRRGAATVLARKPKWSIRYRRMEVDGVERDVQIGYLQHYYWWHATEALARLQHASWPAWNAALKRALLPKQHKSGHEAGSWDPVGTYGKVGGRVFSTALCALCLEAYYR